MTPLSLSPAKVETIVVACYMLAVFTTSSVFITNAPKGAFDEKDTETDIINILGNTVFNKSAV